MTADTALTARCGGWCHHLEHGTDPVAVAAAMLGHRRAAHVDLIEAPFLTRCERPRCGRLCWGRYCCEMCLASDDGGPALEPWSPTAPVSAVHEQACEDRSRRRDPAWHAGSAAR
jgi:hypothetical protein